jgi:threonylcarbamoyladenosine tRNA methylthiotransferase MtaB
VSHTLAVDDVSHSCGVDDVSGTFAVVTFGCRVNQADSLVIESALKHRGARAVPAEQAGLVVVNTCSVTASADQGARQIIRRIARLNPGVRVIVTGCYATRRPDEIVHLPNVVGVVSNGDKDRLTALAVEKRWLTTSERFGSDDDACGGPLSPGDGGRTALTLRVQTGCEEACSYCIIPQTRGVSRSLPVPQVLSRVEMAIDAGYKELVLTGVHLGSYGRDLADGTSLTSLVRRLVQIDADVLFRISSLEPMDCGDALVEMVCSSPRLAPHFHLPLQHGDDEIISAMRRPYRFDDYERLVHRIRDLMPHASIGSDVIVGFPGERDDQFARMAERLPSLPLTHLHVFPYSDRPGTEASQLRDKVDGAVVRERGRQVREIGTAMTARFRASQVGTTHRALTLDDGWSAVTANYLKVRLDRQVVRNEWIDVRVTGSEPLMGAITRLRGFAGYGGQAIE